MIELDATYNHKIYERKWWDFWTKGKYFEANRQSKKPPFTVLMPPPNVTDRLHMGHGLNNTVQDILIRWKRMCGFEALWLPGIDHAGIATQMMVEKSLAKEGLTKQGLGREEFLKRLWKWKEENGGIIIEQLKILGCSADWRREAFTMNERLSRAVRRIFVDLFNEGLIYRGTRLVNWDPVLKTAISDDEIENKEVTSQLWYIRYPLSDNPSESITVATTRPETMLGDTAVAVNPEDQRYKHLIGRALQLPLCERKIPIIADEHVKMDFGTGCVKVTPAHDPNDFEIGQRHQLPSINIMNDDASLNENVPKKFQRLDRFVARKKILADLKELGFFEKEESHKNTVPYGDRSKALIEPRLSRQWFLNMKPLCKKAIAAAEEGSLRFFPDFWKSTYLHWLTNIQDWCISRQLWWGHRIPIWYCTSCNEATTGMEDPKECPKCHGKSLKQDEDVLDTWFSSWLWPLSTLGWPDDTKDLDHFYPTDVLITAPEIIFLWVARMIMVGYKVKGELPFKDIYFNATVCDKDGRKMSKTLGNGIDPLEVIEKHGTDATRFTCVHLAPLGGRVRMSLGDFEVGARFINKIWNAARFLFRYVDTTKNLCAIDWPNLRPPEKWLVHELHLATEKINNYLENYRINDAVETLYHFIWGSFCDWGVESAKDILGEDLPSKTKDQTISTLICVFEKVLRLASPIIPFVTEEIWQKMPPVPPISGIDRKESLVISPYPKKEDVPTFAKEASEWADVQNVISGIRSLRSQANIAPKELLEAEIRVDKNLIKILRAGEGHIKRLSNLSKVGFHEDLSQRPPQSLVAVGKGFEAYVPVGNYLDIAAEKKRLSNEINRIEKILDGLSKKLSNEEFTKKAPKDVVEKAISQKENLSSQLASLRKNLACLV